MALKSDLAFGMMRLPVNSEDPIDINFDELNQCVFDLESGFKNLL